MTKRYVFLLAFVLALIVVVSGMHAMHVNMGLGFDGIPAPATPLCPLPWPPIGC